MGSTHAKNTQIQTTLSVFHEIEANASNRCVNGCHTILTTNRELRIQASSYTIPNVHV